MPDLATNLVAALLQAGPLGVFAYLVYNEVKEQTRLLSAMRDSLVAIDTRLKMTP